MGEKAHDKERNSCEKEEIKLNVLSARQQSSSRSPIKRFDALGPARLKHRDSLLDIRPTHQSSKNETHPDSSLITINISGNRFQTYLSTLQIYPDTLLGDENKRKAYWNSATQEYFFDRHRACFESILYYYQSHGRLRRPDFVPLDTFLEEIAFFQLGPEASAQVHQTENISVVKQTPMPRMLWRRYIWYYFEFPQHSNLARGINLLSMFFTIVSCLAVAIESLPVHIDHWEDICKTRANVSLNSTNILRCSALFSSPFFIIQTICVAYFVIEFFLRLISTPSYYRFILSPFNWFDLGAIVPYFVFLGIQLNAREISLNNNAAMGLRLLRILRLSRILKLYSVFRRLKTLRVLGATLKESLMDFAVMIMFLTVIAFLFGAAVYFAEQDANGNVFDSIPKATYWGIITITGVGYGDMYPVTAFGRIITCLCAFVGSGMMAMLVSVLVDRYQRVYNQKMYIPQDEIPCVEFNPLRSTRNDSTHHIGTKNPSRKISRRQQLSDRLSSIYRRFQRNHDQSSHQAHQVQFAVSFDGKSIDIHDAENIVTTMKEKVTEVIPDKGTIINLQLMEKKNDRLWTIYDSNATQETNVNVTENI